MEGICSRSRRPLSSSCPPPSRVATPLWGDIPPSPLKTAATGFTLCDLRTLACKWWQTFLATLVVCSTWASPFEFVLQTSP
ncbi:hypothetical protein Taro_005115 [Colocasia esculenta]|uniref:Uncharacterized protein n=1 Tax=Colocasia esculenta TaxID=4460 RepID=A0A843TX02_COLES|nr:hypothetical protein [Colocasia esculenta]